MLSKVAAFLLCLSLTGCTVVCIKARAVCVQPVTGSAEVEIMTVK